MEGRTGNAIRNIKYGLLNTLITSLLPFITRTVFIRILGQEYLGIDSVFLNVINLLEIVNIGIGSAITYSVYKPIAQGDTERCKTLFRLYRTCYYTMGAVIFAVGIGITPFLDNILKNKPDIPENIYLIYFIILSGVASGYFFSDKQCILNAHQKAYIISATRMIVVGIINLVEIILLLLTKQYLIYLIVQTCQNFTINLIIHYKAKNIYPQFFCGKIQPLETEDKSKIVKNTVALVFNRAGSLIINCTDNLIIASQVNVESSGLYSNYLVLKNMVSTFTSVVTQSLTASIGNLNASGQNHDKKRINEVFSQIYFINFLVHAFCSICLFCLTEPFIKLWIGDSYCMGIGITAIMTANFYFLGVQKTAEQFKSACGLYWQDRHRVLVEAILNLIISLILVKSLGVLGVLLGTLISNICVTFWVEPLIVHKYALNSSVAPFLAKSFLHLFITAILCGGIWVINKFVFGLYGGLLQFVFRTVLTVGLAVVLLCLCFSRTKNFRSAWKMGLMIAGPFFQTFLRGKKETMRNRLE